MGAVVLEFDKSNVKYAILKSFISDFFFSRYFERENEFYQKFYDLLCLLFRNFGSETALVSVKMQNIFNPSRFVVHLKSE